MHRLITMAVVVALLGACGGNSVQAGGAGSAEIASLETRIEKLEQGALAAQLAAHDVAFLRPADSGYSLLDADFGRVAFSLQNVQPYANGSRITLQLGNPTMASFSGIKAEIAWGRSDKNGGVMTEGEHSMAFAPSANLPAGSWRNFTVTLADIPPSELGWIKISRFDSGTTSMNVAPAAN